MTLIILLGRGTMDTHKLKQVSVRVKRIYIVVGYWTKLETF